MIVKYLKFLTKATNQHGVHSPFVYQLVTKCIYQKSTKKTKANYSNSKKKLYKNNSIINVTDFGSGSRVFKSNQRKVSAIAKNAGISTKYALLLNRLVAYLEINSVLELGTSLGLATNAIVLNNKKVLVDTLEGCPETLKVANDLFEFTDVQKQIKCYQGKFKNTIENVVADKKYDLIYFDGNHQKEATLNYFKKCLKNKHNNSVFVFDDIYWSDGMEEAWEIIKNHPEVKVTVDLFQWGMVFFRKEQEKEHFKIRF